MMHLTHWGHIDVCGRACVCVACVCVCLCVWLFFSDDGDVALSAASRAVAWTHQLQLTCTGLTGVQ